MTDFGRYRERITLQQKTLTTSASGEQQETWATLATVWAQVLPISGREMAQAGAVMSETVYRVRIRYRADVSELTRAVWGSRTLAFSAVANVGGLYTELEITATEVK